jgi:hypothetical protein
MMFQVGDVVVCVDATPTSYWQTMLLSRGLLYRVVSTGCTPAGNSAINVGFVEVDGTLAWYRTYRFRKLRKADLDIFALADRRVPVSA